VRVYLARQRAQQGTHLLGQAGAPPPVDDRHVVMKGRRKLELTATGSDGQIQKVLVHVRKDAAPAAKQEASFVGQTRLRAPFTRRSSRVQAADTG
jgi:hypothetical protein